MELNKILKGLGRLLWLFVIANICIVVLSVVGLVVWANISTVQAIGWHLRHGNKVALDGHIFHVPLLWNCTPDTRPKSLKLEEDHEILGGLNSIDLSATGKVLDSTAARRWQAEHIASVNRTAPDTLSGEIIHGKHLEFVCLRNNIGGIGDSLFCRVSNTDLSVDVFASKKYRTETRAILETSD